MSVLDGGKCRGGCSLIVRKGATGKVRFHVIDGEGAVGVEGDATRAGVVSFAIYEVAGLARGG